jgi:hypothetical protein
MQQPIVNVQKVEITAAATPLRAQLRSQRLVVKIVALAASRHAPRTNGCPMSLMTMTSVASWSTVCVNTWQHYLAIST